MRGSRSRWHVGGESAPTRTPPATPAARRYRWQHDDHRHDRDRTTTTTTTGEMGDTGGASNGSTGGSTNSGTSGAFNGSGGVVGAGGSVITCPGPCDAVACGPGWYSYLPPGACCPTCACAPFQCASCAPGRAPPAAPGQCCGTCVADPQSCDSGRMSYEAFRKQAWTNTVRSVAKPMTTARSPARSTAAYARCGVALPGVTAGDWKSNSLSMARRIARTVPPR